jgi:hypothetical protein
VRLRASIASAAAALSLVGCARPYRIPDLAPGPVASPEVRGTQASARAISGEQQLQIVAEVVRSFFRPSLGQARWIDPRPLAHRRTRDADSAAPADEDWAEGIVQAAGLRRVCTLDAGSECTGRAGGILRFSAPYAEGCDSVVVFARYAPVSSGEWRAPGSEFSEMEFHLVRRDREWRIVSKRTVSSPT